MHSGTSANTLFSWTIKLRLVCSCNCVPFFQFVAIFLGGGGLLLHSTECILFTLFFSAAAFIMSHGYRSWMQGHFRLWQPS